MADPIKVNIEDLSLGMYITKLDIPWLDSPFLFQGFYIDSNELLNKVAETCNYVFVDPEESVVPVHHTNPTLKTHNDVNTSNDDPVTGVHQSKELANEVKRYKKFRQDLAEAIKINIETKSYVNSILHEVRLGNNINVKSAEMIINSIVEKITKNPHAMIWFTNLKNKNEYTANHSLNVCIIALAFGNYLGMKRDQLRLLAYGALFHDIGKMQIPIVILDKPGQLTEKEYEEIKRHPVHGYDLLKSDDNFPTDALDIVLSHHERNDGTGYPRGLSSGQIHYLTKLVSIVDTYDAITTSRVYHEPITPHEALSKMFTWVPGHFDKKLVEQFIKCLGIYPVGSLVELNTGEVGIVVSINDAHHLKPVILLLMNQNREFYSIRKLVNLASPILSQLQSPPEIVHVLNAELEKIDLGKIIIEESYG